MSESVRFRPNPFTPGVPPPVIVPGVRVYDEGGDARFKGVDLWVSAIRIDDENAAASHRYPYVSGGTIEPLGRNPVKATLTCEFFGANWQDRRDEVRHMIQGDQTSGLLELPDGPQFDAFCRTCSETRDPTMDGTTLELAFEEDAHTDVTWSDTAEESPAAAVAALVPAADSVTLDDLVAAFTSILAYESLYSVSDLTAATQILDAAILARMDAVTEAEMLTTDGVDRFDALMLMRWRARQAAGAEVSASLSAVAA